MSRNKLLTSAIALGTAAALTLGGTFAWQSISQTGTLEASNVVNPGGRLHDDFNGENKDVYVENFDEDDIFARVRLEEFFEIVMNANTPAEKSIPMIGSKERAKDEDGNELKTENDNPIYNYEYVVFTGYDKINAEDNTVAAGLVKDEGAGDEDPAHSWWTWTLGGQTVFMPTFNKNKDSLKADINGKYLFDTGMLSSKDDDQYSEMKEYTDGQKETKFSINDIDSNQVDELENLSDEDFDKIIETGTVPDTYNKNVKTKSEEHTAKPTAEAKLISMEEWLNMVKTEETDGEGNPVYEYDETTHGNYWVYDDDGWVYWSAPIHGGEATGLLLNGIELAETMDNSWYYGLNVVGQFCTAGDLGEPGVTNDDGSTTAGTGFYADGGKVSTEALTLLDIIGVNDTWSEGDEHEYDGVTLYLGGGDNVASVSDKSLKEVALTLPDKSHPAADELEIHARVDGTSPMSQDDEYTYDEETGILTITMAEDSFRVNENGTTAIRIAATRGEKTYHGAILWDDDGQVKIGTDSTHDCSVAMVGQTVQLTGYRNIDVLDYYDTSASEYGEALDSSSYTLEDMKLTITDDAYAGKLLRLQGGDGESYGFLYVVAYKAPELTLGSKDDLGKNFRSIAFGDSVSLRMPDGSIPEKIEIYNETAGMFPSPGEGDYTYEDGVLTITNELYNKTGIYLEIWVKDEESQIIGRSGLIINDDGKIRTYDSYACATVVKVGEAHEFAGSAYVSAIDYGEGFTKDTEANTLTCTDESKIGTRCEFFSANTANSNYIFVVG